MWCNGNFVSVLTALNNIKSKENLTLHHTEKTFISELDGIKFKIWRATFFNCFLPLNIFGGMDFRFEMRQILGNFIV